MAGAQRGEDLVASPDFRRLFRGLPTAYLVMSPELVIADANDAYLALLGRTRAELVGRAVFEAFPPTPDALTEDGANPVQVSFERARETGRPDPMALQKYDVLDPATGRVVERYWSLISAAVLDDQGAVVLVVQRVEDVTAYVQERQGRQDDVERGQAWRRRAEEVEADLYARVQELRAAQEAKDVAARRLASLGEVALALTGARSVQDLERIVVGRGLGVIGAQGGGIVSPDDRGGWRATLSAALGEHAQVVYGHLPYDSPLPGPWSARTGRRLLLPSVASGLAFDAGMAEVYEDTQRRGWAFLPLTVSGECLGSLAVAWAEEHLLGQDELDLLDGFAAQCAQALQRLLSAQAQREAALAVQRMSETLQRSLLTQPPVRDSLAIAVRYAPAAQDAQVGGDWYDAFVTAAGATWLVVGDITGHDQAAAAAMGQVRNLLRGMAYYSRQGPAVLLSQLDGALPGLGLDTMATAVLARLEDGPDHGGDPGNPGDPEGSGPASGSGARRLRWSNAGHPPPLLRSPDGAVQVLQGKADLLLGLDPTTVREEDVVDLVPGSTLLLYTDGLVERRDASLDEGIARLAAVLAAVGDQEVEALADRLLAAMGSRTHEDDTALLLVRLDSPGPDGQERGA